MEILGKVVKSNSRDDIVFSSIRGINLETLCEATRDAIREEAENIPGFDNGCIRLTMVPLSELAHDWLTNGQGQKYDANDIVEFERIYKINPSGTHTIMCHDDEDDHTKPVNCYAYSALKTAFRSYMYNHNQQRPAPEDAGFFVEGNGWSVHRGSVLCDVYDPIRSGPVMRVYVCVSGAKAEEDEQCAIKGAKIVQAAFVAADCTVTIS